MKLLHWPWPDNACNPLIMRSSHSTFTFSDFCHTNNFRTSLFSWQNQNKSGMKQTKSEVSQTYCPLLDYDNHVVALIILYSGKLEIICQAHRIVRQGLLRDLWESLQSYIEYSGGPFLLISKPFRGWQFLLAANFVFTVAATPIYAGKYI